MFWIRLISGVALLLLSFLFVFLGGYSLAIILCIISLTAFYEMFQALQLGKGKKVNSLCICGFIGIIGYYILLMLDFGTEILVMEVVTTIIVFLAIYVFAYPKYVVEDITGIIFALIYAPIMLSFLALTRRLPNGEYIAWIIYISSWGYDTCAYAVGMATGKLFGNHKITPKLSPKKSLEGVIGGVIGVAIIAWLFSHFALARVVTVPYMDWLMAAVAGIGALIAQIGDLAASAVKRNKDVKDYGKCIPGHGGILDRFDSMIFTAPITYFLVLIILQLNK